MANLIESDNWPAGIYQIEEDDPVLGGAAGTTNVPPTQLAARTRFQRLRSITPWSNALAYPSSAFVAHAGTTWKSIVANADVEPGTDATKWVRWGHSAEEIGGLLDGSVAAHVGAADPHVLYALRASFAEVPALNRGAVITVSTPHLRQMVWNGSAYVRAPWNQPGMVMYSVDNPASIPGYLPVRADVVYYQANYPDLVARLGLSGAGTFSLMELRGEFIRCLDNGRTVDASRVHGSFQKGTLVGGYDDNSAGSNTTVLNNKASVDYGSDPVSLIAPTLYPDAAGVYLTASSMNPTPVATSYFSITRPRNIALPAWVSY